MRLDPEDILAKRAIVLGGIPNVSWGMITVRKDVPAPIQMVLTTPAAAGHRMREPSPTNNHGILRLTGGGCSGGAKRGRIVVVAAPPSNAVPHQPLQRLPSATPIVVNGMYGNGPLLLPSPTRDSAGAADPTVLWVPCHFCTLLCHVVCRGPFLRSYGIRVISGV